MHLIPPLGCPKIRLALRQLRPLRRARSTLYGGVISRPFPVRILQLPQRLNGLRDRATQLCPVRVTAAAVSIRPPTQIRQANILEQLVNMARGGLSLVVDR